MPADTSYSLRIGARKMLRQAVHGGAALLAGHIARKYGVDLPPGVIETGAFAVLEGARNLLKRKLPRVFAWL